MLYTITFTQLDGIHIRISGFTIAHAFFNLNQEWYVFRFVSIRNFSTWDRNYKKRPQACTHAQHQFSDSHANVITPSPLNSFNRWDFTSKYDITVHEH